jgi:hypothetical protein
VPFRTHDGWMRHKKSKKEIRDETRARVKKEMGKPRMARSAKIAEMKLNTTRIPEPASTSMPGTVDRIILSGRTGQPEKAQITVDLASPRHRRLRIENTLVDEHGDDVKLKKGEHVAVSVTADPEAAN